MGDILGSIFSTAGIIIILGIIILIASIKIVQEYERGVIFRLGRLQGAKGPGLFFIIPFVDRMIKVDLRVVTLDIPTQEAITRDNVTVSVNAVAYFRVIDPNDAIVKVEDYNKATWQIAQTSLRSVLGQSDLDELLIHRDEINQKLAADHRRSHRTVGHQGQHRRGQGRGAARHHEAGHGPPGRGRARKAGQDHPRRRRVRRRPAAPGGGRRAWPRNRRRSNCATCRR